MIAKFAASLFSRSLISPSNTSIGKVAMSTASKQYKTLKLTVPKPFVYHVELNRPDKLNAFNRDLWTEIEDCFTSLNSDEDCRVVVVSAAGKLFTAGLDFTSMIELGQRLANQEDVARRCKILNELIVEFQDSMSSLEKCVKPVMCLIHNACIGAGLNLITAADIRYCTDDAYFSVKEVDIGLAADIGVLQRLPRVVGSASLVNELAFTARKLDAMEAKECGLVNRLYTNKENMVKEALDVAEEIASKSPVAVQGTKRSLVYSRDHSVQEGLNHIAMWNQTMIQSEDFMNASVAQATKGSVPVFAKL
uniref:Delta(3,5)-Delta(2,4)-dienoyl-CoA isomerase, mitochondrial n=2 Tax=Lygus hesperus TaxID=30085 RepID=A0A0A9Y7G8_LYGHE